MIASVLDLRVRLDREPDYRVRLHALTQWLNSNDRGHWRKYAAPTQQWRQAAGWAARAARVPVLTRVYILAELNFTNAIHRDPANWYPTVKACVDGLVDVCVLPNDTAAHVVGPDIRLGPQNTAPPGSLTLHLWRLP